MPFVKIATVSELPPEGEAREFSVGEKTICVANNGEGYTAMDNVCVHRGGPLGGGVVDGQNIVCPWHGWEFNLHTGQCAHDPTARVPVYPLKIEGGDVLVGLDA